MVDRQNPVAHSTSRVFEGVSTRHGDVVALLGAGSSLSYRELNARANQLARWLVLQGVGPEQVVAVRMGRCVESVTAVLAIWKAGGAYMPLPLNHPPERAAFQIEETDCRLLLTRSSEVMEFDGVATHRVDADRSAWSGLPDHDLDTGPSLDDLAWVLYTSGSTGRPKGVMGTHRGTLNRCRWIWSRDPYSVGEPCVQNTGLHVVDAIWELWGPLGAGATVVLPTEAALGDPTLLLAELLPWGITRITLVPSLLEVFLEQEEALRPLGATLKQWVASGEPLRPGLVKRFYQVLPDCVLLNQYGLTETHADMTSYDTRDGVGERVAIGRPIADAVVHVLDEALRPVPMGEVGELCIAGDCLARGYWKHPRLTAERFIHNPFGEGRLLRTGDLVRCRPDGQFEHMGRRDRQVKIRGYRIELDEIEHALQRQEPVRSAAVRYQDQNTPDQGGAEAALIAYVTARPGQSIDTAMLRRSLARTVPAHMIPNRIHVLDAMPTTPTGKLDYQALAAAKDAQAKKALAAGQHQQIETSVIRQWVELLPGPVGAETDFFVSGGHSLMAVRLLHRLSKEFDITISLATFMSRPTPSSLAGEILAALGVGKKMDSSG